MTELGNSDLLSSNTLFCGQSIRINASSDNTSPSISYPNGKKKSLEELPFLFNDTDLPGAYILEKAEGKTEAFAVNFDTTESRLVSQSTVSMPGDSKTVVVDATAASSKSYRPLLIILLLLIMAVEWIIYIKD